VLVTLALLLFAPALAVVAEVGPRVLAEPRGLGLVAADEAQAIAVLVEIDRRTQEQVVNWDAREACAETAWNPWLHAAVNHLLTTQFADAAARFREQYATGLVRCYLGDMGNASEGLTPARSLLRELEARAE
jgi:hypothetical protein